MADLECRAAGRGALGEGDPCAGRVGRAQRGRHVVYPVGDACDRQLHPRLSTSRERDALMSMHLNERPVLLRIACACLPSDQCWQRIVQEKLRIRLRAGESQDK